MKIYNNYHKHDALSILIGMPDSCTVAEEYIKKAVEYGHTSYFTTNHGNMGDIFESYSLCRKYGIKCYAGLEGYIVKDAKEKDDRNYHIVLIPKTDVGRKKLNKINSYAHMYGFYKRPRIDLKDLLELNPDDVFITTACAGGFLRDDDGYNDIFMPLYDKFGDSLMLEIQNHKADFQVKYNNKALELHNELGLKLIAANDSHAVDERGLERRRQIMLSKRLQFTSEEELILDYPDYDTLFNRFKEQGCFTDEQIVEAIDNTLIFSEECEELILHDDIKMPTIYGNLTPKERVEELKKTINQKLPKVFEEDKIPLEEQQKYIDGLSHEMKIIEETNDVCHTADYFLFNTKMVELATTKYKGVLTNTGRGSCGSFYTNRVLGMTQLDRFRIKLPSFPERFMSTARLIENRAMPDIDFNVVSQEPFVLATRELLGEHGCYPMVAYKPYGESDAFRNVCRTHELQHKDFNEIAKNIDEYRNDPKWKPLIDEAQQYVGIPASVSPHPCAHVLSDKNILEEYGVVRVGDEDKKSVSYCVLVTSVEADTWKILKNDYLVVTVWKLIDEACKNANIPIPNFNDLLNTIENNDKVWGLVEKGLTCTVNQMDTDNGKKQAMQFKTRSFTDVANLSAAIRPSFDSWRERFLNRDSYSTGADELDEVLSMTDHYILYQENLMQFFEWLGVLPAESIGLIKKISKKKIKESDFIALEERIRKQWIINTGSDEKFDKIWEEFQNCMAYGYCSMHGAAVGGDACYSLYLKAYYPIEYYTACFNVYDKDMRRTALLTDEMKYFGITISPAKFRYSKGTYWFDKEKNVIYKGAGSIKGVNSQACDELYELRNNKYDTFTELLHDISNKTSAKANHVAALIKIGYFSEFGTEATLLKIQEKYRTMIKRKAIKKSELQELGLQESIIRKYATKETASGFTVSMVYVCSELEKRMDSIETSILDIIKWQRELLGYIEYTNSDFDIRMAVATEVKTFNYLSVAKFYCIKNGKTAELMIYNNHNYKNKRVKTVFNKNKLEEGDIVYLADMQKLNKTKKDENGKRVPIEGVYDWWLYDYRKCSL